MVLVVLGSRGTPAAYGVERARRCASGRRAGAASVDARAQLRYPLPRGRASGRRGAHRPGPWTRDPGVAKGHAIAPDIIDPRGRRCAANVAGSGGSEAAADPATA